MEAHRARRARSCVRIALCHNDTFARTESLRASRTPGDELAPTLLANPRPALLRLRRTTRLRTKAFSHLAARLTAHDACALGCLALVLFQPQWQVVHVERLQRYDHGPGSLAYCAVPPQFVYILFNRCPPETVIRTSYSWLHRCSSIKCCIWRANASAPRARSRCAADTLLSADPPRPPPAGAVVPVPASICSAVRYRAACCDTRSAAAVHL